MKPRAVVVLVALACVPSGATTAVPAAPVGVLHGPPPADRAAIADILAEQDRAWASGDADAYTARALPEISFTNVVGAYSVGKDPLLAQVRKIFSTIYKGSRNKTTLVNISMIDTDFAVVDTISELRGFAKPGMESVVVDGATYSRLQETLVRRGGQWWIASIHNVFISPASATNDRQAK